MAPIERKSAKESKGNLRGAAAYCLNLVAVPRLLYGQSAGRSHRGYNEYRKHAGLEKMY